MIYERISIPPEDAQFITTRKFQKTEIASFYGISLHMIADLERATNGIEHQGEVSCNTVWCRTWFVSKKSSIANCCAAMPRPVRNTTRT